MDPLSTLTIDQLEKLLKDEYAGECRLIVIGKIMRELVSRDEFMDALIERSPDFKY